MTETTGPHIEFKLELTIKGSSLQEVDDGLVRAAGERLQARIQQRAEGKNVTTPTLPFGVQIKQSEPEATEAIEAVEAAEQKRGRGRPPGAVGSYKKKGDDHGQKEKSSKEDQKSEAQETEVAKTTLSNTTSPGAKTKSPGESYPTYEQAVMALSNVCEKFSSTNTGDENQGVEKGRETLNKFNVKRVKDLKDDQRAEFIDYCKGLIGE